VRTLAFVLLLPMLALAEPAALTRATELKKEPATDAVKVADLAENTMVDAMERQGGWIRVRTQGGAEGWVKLLALRYGGPGAARPGDSGLSQAFNVARTGASGTQVTTGVRGLEAEQIANARPNPGELAKMGGYAADRDSAAGFASEARLEPRSVPYPQP
jgi:hypothetical protein